MSDEVFERLLADAVRELNEHADPPQTLQRLVEMAPELFASCDFLGVSLAQYGEITTPAASDEHVRVLDEAQYALGEGPCREAILRDPTVTVDDLATDPRWPTWGRAMVAELGSRSSSIYDEQLVSALETGTVIGQATGILMERYELDAETAFNVLRRISDQENRKLRDVAVQVVSTRELPRPGSSADL